ncbi:MAG: hypothetical protein ACI89L_001667 [Phycisphaerales bacterium]|jgi:hypothetical protein
MPEAQTLDLPLLDRPRVVSSRPAMTLNPEAITQLLSEVEARPEAANELLPLVYDQLRGIAASRMKSERPGHTRRRRRWCTRCMRS